MARAPYSRPSTIEADGGILWLAGAAVAALMITMSTELQWLGIALSASIFIVVLWAHVIWRVIRRCLMRRPFSVHFRFDESGKGPRELRVRPNDFAHIQINRKVRVTHLEHELIVGFGGDQDERPRIVEVENKFVKQGQMRSLSPATTDKHYIDDKDNYHIMDEKQLVRGNTYSSGFVVKTGSPGRYQVQIQTIHDTGEGKPMQELVLIVDEWKAAQKAARK